MASQIHLIRHAESVHNVTKNYSVPDPSLTERGVDQASQLYKFPSSSSVGIILTSPLKRTIQTTLAGFAHILDKRYFAPGSNSGVEGGVTLVVDPDLQERSDLPCDTGSDREVLEKTFPGVDFSGLVDGWHSKTGPYSADDAAVEDRGKKVRRRLAEIAKGLEDTGKKDIVVMTHGVFMKYLSGDQKIDLPKAAWKSYTITHENDGAVALTPVV